MEISVVGLLVDLVETSCVVVVFAYVFSRTRIFSNLVDKKARPVDYVVLVLGFGALSIFGTYGGIALPAGGIANIRDLGPVVGALVGGPVVGLGAGLIGAIHRYFVGGFVAMPCALATVMAGLAGSVVFLAMKRRFVTWWQGALVAIPIELMHTGLVLLMARPYDEAAALARQVVLPMTGANAIGAAIFLLIVTRLVAERKTRAEKERYRHELERREYEAETARTIQQSLLPETTPKLEGFEVAAFSLPAWEVGGDYYDYIPLESGRWGLVMADASGKGFPAALFMTLSRTCIRACVDGARSASQTIAAANTILCRDAKSGMFLTLFYAVLDAGARRLSYVNAGHNPPLLFKSSTGEVVTLKGEGMALGVMDCVTLEEKEVDIGPNDVIILYTDGLTEAVNAREEQFGVERLAQVIRDNAHLHVDPLIDRVRAEVEAYTVGKPRFDDLTVMAMKKV